MRGKTYAWFTSFLQAACNMLAIALGYVYARMALLPHMPREVARLINGWTIAWTIAVFPLVGAMLWFLKRPVIRALDDPAARDERAKRAALNMPVSQGLVSVLVWILAGLTMIPLWHARFSALPIVLLYHILGLVIVSGIIASTFIFYLVEWSDREHVLPVLFPDGIGEVRGAVGVSIHLKIVIAMLTTSILPIGAIVFDTWSFGFQVVPLVYLGSCFVAFGAMQGGLIVRSIDLPLRALLREANRVRDNDLGARARVVSADAIGKLGDGFNAMVEGLRRARFVEETFGRYLTPQVRDEILAGRIHLGGERRRATVLFCDVRGFTSLSEKLSPEDVVLILNKYLDLMVEALVEEGATIDKFLGDGILAVFGVPLAQEDGARRAVRAALSMLERLDAWNAERKRAGGAELAIGIGVHTGEVVAGNIGSARKMEYTIIGDAVNTASRIEGLNRQLGTRLLVSSEVHAEVAADVDARQLEPVEVRGKAKPLALFEVLSARAAASSRTARPAPSHTA